MLAQILAIYLLGCVIARILMDVYNVPEENHKFKWLSWIIIIMLITHNTFQK